MDLTFHGAAGEGTGSCHVLHVAGKRILLDCGQIQGSREDQARNRDPFVYEVIDEAKRPFEGAMLRQRH